MCHIYAQVEVCSGRQPFLDAFPNLSKMKYQQKDESLLSFLRRRPYGLRLTQS